MRVVGRGLIRFRDLFFSREFDQSISAFNNQARHKTRKARHNTHSLSEGEHLGASVCVGLFHFNNHMNEPGARHSTVATALYEELSKLRLN